MMRLLILASILSLALAGWTTSVNNGVTTATHGAYTIEGKTVADDKVYDLGAMDVKTVFGENVPTAVTAEQKTAMEAKMTPVHTTSLNVILKHNGKVVFGLAEGKATDFVKPANDGEITGVMVKELLEAVKTLTLTDERMAAAFKTIPNILEGVLQDRSKDAIATAGKTGTSGKVFLELGRKVSRRQQTLDEAKTGVPANLRYYVEIHIGNAFGIPLGHHSGSVISARDAATGAVVNTFVRCNHGRCPGANGMAYKCTHAGAATIPFASPQPASWDCNTSYWPVYCFNIIGASHNCNANAQHQIDISDAPAAPPADNVGICAADCPRLSPAC